MVLGLAPSIYALEERVDVVRVHGGIELQALCIGVGGFFLFRVSAGGHDQYCQEGYSDDRACPAILSSVVSEFVLGLGLSGSHNRIWFPISFLCFPWGKYRYKYTK